MYVAVVSTILGQGLILGNVRVVEYGALVAAVPPFVLVYAEPTLRSSFGSEYKLFCTENPRWIPRFTPWRGHPQPRDKARHLADENGRIPLAVRSRQLGRTDASLGPWPRLHGHV